MKVFYKSDWSNIHQCILFILKRLQVLTEEYLDDPEGQFTVDILKEMTSK